MDSPLIPEGVRRCSPKLFFLWTLPWLGLLAWGGLSAFLCLYKGLNQTNDLMDIDRSRSGSGLESRILNRGIFVEKRRIGGQTFSIYRKRKRVHNRIYEVGSMLGSTTTDCKQETWPRK